MCEVNGCLILNVYQHLDGAQPVIFLDFRVR
jgi:hypothetical protein